MQRTLMNDEDSDTHDPLVMNVKTRRGCHVL